ncbi:ABC transporter ATP-binding protein [Amycolatopsis oliviviridis]|uniref:ABC transporter ATP-binding protein n=1 Tax=Amycolatopsis oliviviridis TaxID=1471590 RepID=A0ABQ3L7G4_9PSEU|nr:ABC transporter ATP-binding protein [Amycolatopsis oliviviridis]GHH04802.1 ABC transporter ATP-binding protein [Amycolatopsis oliviviridis]
MTSVRQVVLRDLLRRRPVLTAFAVGGAAVALACELLVPSSLADAVAAMSGRGVATGPLLALATVLGIGLVASVVAGQVTVRGMAETTARHRRDLLEKTLSLPVRQREFSPGDLLTRFSGDANAPAQLGFGVIGVLITAAGSVVALVALWFLDPWLTGLVGAELVVSWFAVRVFLRRVGDAETRYRTARGRLAALLVDAHTGIRTIRACRTRDRELRRILGPLAELRSAGLDAWRSQREIGWRMGLLTPFQEVALLSVAGFGVLSGRLDGGEVLAALFYSQLALGLLEQVDALVSMVYSAANSRRLLEVHDAPSVPVPSRPRALPRGDGEIRFEDVAVGPLSRVTFTVPAGTHVALVGRSGSGKSSLVGTVGRLSDAESGRVVLDGVDVREVEPSSLRSEIAYAFDEPSLFGVTIGDAIAATAPLPGSAVARAARQARADLFVRRLPDGYGTSADRLPLSGGEIQRLGLARALARPARVLVLDDAMSNVDTATAAEISRAIRSAWRSRTALVVAHRVVTAAGSDLVAWLDDGGLRALAPHHELWRDDGYRELFAVGEP